MSGARSLTRSPRRRVTPAVALAGAVLALPLVLPSGGVPAAASTLPRCPTLASWPVKPVSPIVKATLTKYYAARHLTPMTVVGNRMRILNVVLERTGVHWCLNEGGGRAGYVGVVPKTAKAAVLVQVRHKPYPVVGSATTWATVVQLPTGWKVVSDDTAP